MGAHLKMLSKLLNDTHNGSSIIGVTKRVEKQKTKYETVSSITCISHLHNALHKFNLKSKNTIYKDCSNMNASSVITFVSYMLRQTGISFFKGLDVTFKLAPDLNKTTVYLSSYSPSSAGRYSILTN